MSDRLDVVIVGDGGATIHHQRWGATSLYAMLVEGPERATAMARSFDATAELDDLLAGCVIDPARRTLVIAGPADVITSAGPRGLQPQEVLPELAPLWPGWHLVYEPDFVIEPVALYVRGLGLPLASLNEPHALAAIEGTQRFVAAAYSLVAPAPAEQPTRAPTAGRALTDAERARSLDELDDLSIRAMQELRAAGLATFGDVFGHGRDALARRGVSQKVLNELGEFAEFLGFAL